TAPCGSSTCPRSARRTPRSSSRCWGAASADQVGLGLGQPLALLGAPLLVGTTQLPVATGRQALGGQPALHDEVTANEADSGGLTVHEGVALPVGEIQRGDRVELERGVLAGP